MNTVVGRRLGGERTHAPNRILLAHTLLLLQVENGRSAEGHYRWARGRHALAP